MTNEQEIRAKALEIAIAVFQMLPEKRREQAIKNEIKNGIDVFNQIKNVSNIFHKYITEQS